MADPHDTATAPPMERLIDAALPHVPFDGWSEATLRHAARDAGLSIEEARALCPRGPVDLALAFHARGDRRMAAALASEDLSGLRFREKVARAVQLRIEAIPDREAIRRASALYALPPYAADGARALWSTADAIWTALGDRSDGLDHYTKRATLSGVYASTVLYWLGDDSQGSIETWAFLDRRIEDVMRIEKVKARVNGTPVLRELAKGPGALFDRLRRAPRMDMPGHWAPGAPPGGDWPGGGPRA